MKPTVFKIEKFIEKMEQQLSINQAIRPRWVRVLVDGEPAQSAIDRHLAANPQDAGCNWIAEIILDPPKR